MPASMQDRSQFTQAEWIEWYLEWGYAEYGRASWTDDEWQTWAFAQLAEDSEAPSTPGDLLVQHGRLSAVSLPPSPTLSETAEDNAAACAAQRDMEVVLDFGKYKGKSFRSVRTTNPSYIRWMATKGPRLSSS